MLQYVPPPHARQSPPWSFCGDEKSPDFGTVFATHEYGDAVALWFDRPCTQHAMTFKHSADVGEQVVICGRLFDVSWLPVVTL